MARKPQVVAAASPVGPGPDIQSGMEVRSLPAALQMPPMFTGAINQHHRKFYATIAPQFADRRVIVGCSGNFTVEAIVRAATSPELLLGNDVSLYSCMIGRYLSGQEVEYTIVGEDIEFVKDHVGSSIERVAVLPALLTLLKFQRRSNEYEILQWNRHVANFGLTVSRNVQIINKVPFRLDGFFEGDVFDHFQMWEDDRDAVFLVNAPTYAGGYEKLYQALDHRIKWASPHYNLMGAEERNRLYEWLQGRNYVWYEDRVIAGRDPVFRVDDQQKRPTYIYTDLPGVKPAYINSYRESKARLSVPLADKDIEITKASRIWLHPLPATEVSVAKDIFLGKGVRHGMADWSFAVMCAGSDGLGYAIGFIEFKCFPGQNGDEAFLQADFPIAGTKYEHLAKLMAMLATAGETRRQIERRRQLVTRRLYTKVYAKSGRTVSMKYRGVLTKLPTPKAKGSEDVLTYGAEFNDLTWKKTLTQWIARFASPKQPRRVTPSTPPSET